LFVFCASGTKGQYALNNSRSGEGEVQQQQKEEEKEEEEDGEDKEEEGGTARSEESLGLKITRRTEVQDIPHFGIKNKSTLPYCRSPSALLMASPRRALLPVH
jgi:hypothetical protein